MYIYTGRGKKRKKEEEMYAKHRSVSHEVCKDVSLISDGLLVYRVCLAQKVVKIVRDVLEWK